MRAYISYYEKHNVFTNKKEKIDFIQGYFKDITKCVWTACYKYVKEFPIRHAQWVNTLDRFFVVLLHTCADINNQKRVRMEY